MDHQVPQPPALEGEQDGLLSLTDDLFTNHIFAFLGKGYFRYVGAVSRRFKQTYLKFHNHSTRTSIPQAAMESIATAALMTSEIDESCAQKLTNGQFSVYAAQTGSIELLDWGLANGFRMDARTCATAAYYGHFKFLQYARVNLLCPWNSFTCTQAAKSGNFAILQWAHATAGCQVTTQTCAAAATAGRLDILQWLHSKGCPWDAATCQCAAETGDLFLLQWARSKQCPWDASTCAAAAKGGHLEVLQWAKSNGADWSAWTCHYAAQNNHMEVLVWARENGCGWDAQTCAEAAIHGHFEILKWARHNGCTWHADACYRFAESNGHHEMAEWIRVHSKDEHRFINGVMQLFAEEEGDDDAFFA